MPISSSQVLSGQDPVATRMVQQLGSRDMQVWRLLSHGCRRCKEAA